MKNNMRTVTLGHSGIEVSSLCLGAMNLGTKVNEEGSFQILDRYVEAGGCFIDTANMYAHWWGGTGHDSETVLGNWMRARGNRKDIILATKVGFNTPDVGEGLSEGLIRSELAGSLERLRTDYVDLYYAHQDHRQTPLEETLGTFNALHQAGLVRAIGCSNYRAWRIERARTLSRINGWVEYCCVQQRHTYLRPVPGADTGAQLIADKELFDYCRENSDFSLLAYSPTLGGAYSRQDRPIREHYIGVDTESRLAALHKVAAVHSATPIQVILAWMLASNPAAMPLVSAGTLEQLDENLGSLDIQLSQDEMHELDAAGSPY